LRKYGCEDGSTSRMITAIASARATTESRIVTGWYQPGNASSKARDTWSAVRPSISAVPPVFVNPTRPDTLPATPKPLQQAVRPASTQVVMRAPLLPLPTKTPNRTYATANRAAMTPVMTWTTVVVVDIRDAAPSAPSTPSSALAQAFWNEPSIAKLTIAETTSIPAVRNSRYVATVTVVGRCFAAGGGSGAV
jgi:hypothetical protein